MDSVIKLSPQQRDFRTDGTTNLVDFILPNDGSVYDLSKSYVNVNVTYANGAGGHPSVNGDARYNCKVQYKLNNGSDDSVFVTSAIIKNAAMISQARGKIEDLRQVGALRQNLSVYEKSENDLMNRLNQAQSYNPDVFFGTQPNGVTLNKSGNELSPNAENKPKGQDIRIPLSDIFNFGSQTAYSTQVYGQTRIHLEPQFDKIAVDPRETNALWAARKHYGGGANAGAAPAANDEINEMDNNAGTSADADTVFLTKSALYCDEDMGPWYIGMPVNCTGQKGTTASGGPGVAITANARNIISAIELQASGKLKLTLSGNFDHIGGSLGAGNTFYLPKIDYLDRLHELAVVINNVELVAHINQNPQSIPAQLPYTVFDVEEDSYPTGLGVLSRQYDIPPACRGVVIVMNASNVLSSREQHLNKYRIAIDGKELTPKDIVIGGSIDLDLKNKSVLNRGKRTRNLNELQHAATDNISASANGDHGTESRVIMFPVEFKNKHQKLDLELTAADGQTLGGRLILYKEVAKLI